MQNDVDVKFVFPFQFGFQWPSALDCEKFPQTNNPGTMCMKGPEDPNDPQSGKRRGNEVGSRKDPPTAVVAGGRGEVRCSDRRRPMLWLNSSSRCAIPCGEDLVWSGSQKHLAAVWLGVSAGLSLVLGVAALCAVATGSPKPRYPERALVFVTLCYSVASIGYLAQLLMGRSTVACVSVANGPSVLVQPGLQNVRCTLMFALVYYFNAAALLWWLILATTWSLATGLKWSPEAIEQKSGWFHFPAWFIPVLQTVAVLVRQSVDADELTGLCGVGFHSPEELFRFHILPALISLVAGMALLTLGFCAGLTCCCGPISFGPIRKTTLDANTHVPSSSTMTSVYMGTTIATANRQQYYVAGHLVKLGIFAAFHVVPQGALLAAFFYEYSYQEDWGRKDGPQPNFATFVMKIVASLIFGIVAAVWLLYRRISASWATGRFGQQKAPQSALSYQPHRAVFADKHSLSIAETKLAAHQHYPQLYHHHTII